MLCNILWPLETTMRALPNLVHTKRRLLVGAAALLLGLMQGAPAARQACQPQSLVRLGGNVTSFGESRNSSTSADGRYVAFASGASDLDGDEIRDIFVYDRVTCVYDLVSVDSSGVKGNGSSDRPSISDDGRFVVFTSDATNLIPTDASPSGMDAYLHDRQLGQTVLVSVSSLGVQPTIESASHARISGNGQIVAFVSPASTLVPGDTNDESDLFVRDLAAGTTERVSISSAGQQSESPFFFGVSEPVLSEDGRFIAFQSSMNTLVPDDFNNNSDVFVRDRTLNTTIRASLNSNGVEVLAGATPPAITADGRFVFFGAFDNFVPGNTSCDGIFFRDLVLNTTSCLLLDPQNVTSSQNARRPAVSADGRYVAFTSFAGHYVPGDTNGSTDVFVHDRTTGATHRTNVSASGGQTSGTVRDVIDISADGRIVTFESSSAALVPPDDNLNVDVFAAEWGALPSAPQVNLMRNGSFLSGLQAWQAFATPDLSYVVTDASTGELQFYRVAPPAGTTNQAVVFQNTWARLLAHSPIEARFRLGNSSTVRKRISVLVHDADFSDLFVCTFWLEPAAPMRDYIMRTHTTELWSNATISFYAATAGSDGGAYRTDDVSVIWNPFLDDDVTDCVDPTAPVAPGGVSGPPLLGNGDFAAGLTPWAIFGQITSQITNGVFEFVRPPGTPAGVVLQVTGVPLAQHDILTAGFYLGNSSSVRKRVTLILHDQDFSDLSACTFWLAPNLPLSPYIVRTFATQAWANTTFSLYPATVGLEEWIRFTDATLHVTPGTTPLGTECLEPGAESVLAAVRGLTRPSARMRLRQPPGAPMAPSTDQVIAAYDALPGSHTIWHRVLDLGPTSNPALAFESLIEGAEIKGVAQLSLDGVEWRTLATLTPALGWTTVDLDLSAVAGHIVHVRLVTESAASRPDSSRNRWLVRRIRIQ